MTLSEVIKVIEGVASNQPSINMVVQHNAFKLNDVPDAKYGAFAWVQGQHTASVESSFITYSFFLYYIDRLTHDKSNLIEVQSVGVMTLDNIIKSLEDLGIYTSTPYSFQPFSQRFLDECGGVYVNVSFDVPISSSCPEIINDPNVAVYEGE